MYTFGKLCRPSAFGWESDVPVLAILPCCGGGVLGVIADGSPLRFQCGFWLPLFFSMSRSRQPGQQVDEWNGPATHRKKFFTTVNSFGVDASKAGEKPKIEQVTRLVTNTAAVDHRPPASSAAQKSAHRERGCPCPCRERFQRHPFGPVCRNSRRPRRSTGSSCTARTFEKVVSRSLATWETICDFPTPHAPRCVRAPVRQ